jgi:hypothetical protein
MAYSLPIQFMDGEYSLATATLADIMPELQEKIQVPQNQCCASGFIESGCESGSSISSEPGYGYGSGLNSDPGF